MVFNSAFYDPTEEILEKMARRAFQFPINKEKQVTNKRTNQKK